MRVTVSPSTARGRVRVPPSKSFAQRMLICAALSKAGAVVHGISDSDDMAAAIDCIRALGGECEALGHDVKILKPMSKAGSGICNCRESGSALRFFIPLALALHGGAEFRGTERLMERGVGVYEELFASQGVSFEKHSDRLVIRGELTSGKYALRGDVSSQFVSGLMFAMPLLSGDSEIEVLPPVESRSYIDITVQVLRMSGIRICETERNRFTIPGGQHYSLLNSTAEGDWSNAAFLYALNLSGGEVEPVGLNADSIQGDRVCLDIFGRLNVQNAHIDLSDCPDLGPVVFAAAARTNGAEFTGIHRLRLKESDRVRAMAEELAKFSVRVTEKEDRVIIAPGGIRRPTEPLCGHNDHRIIMALAVLCAEVGGSIDGAEAVKKSYPDFFETLEALGVKIERT